MGPLEGISPKVVAKLIKDLNYPNARIRKYAAFTLGTLCDHKAVLVLIRCLESHSDTVRARRYFACALGIIGDSSALPTLEYMAKDCDNIYLHKELLKAISRVNEKRIQPL